MRNPEAHESRTVVGTLSRRGDGRRRGWNVLGLVACLSLASTAAAHADVVTQWNAVAELVAPRFGGPQPQSRVQAMAQIAVHDALNAIERRYESYCWWGPAAPGAAPDAAVAAATRHTLLTLLAPLPDSAAKQGAIAAIDAAWVATVGPEPQDSSTQAGIDTGTAAAEAILARRDGDGSATPNLPYTLPPGAGVYQPTPNPELPAVVVPSFAGWARVTPFALRHQSQFGVDPGAIFDLAGPEYTREYNEVMQLGDARVRGAQPDSAESDIARFWPGGGSNWNLTARVILESRGLDRWAHARLLALLNIAQADALIANQTWKYTYTFWRPVTAIRWTDDGNPATPADASWRPFLVTPPYPDFPCALPSATGASAEVLREFFGTDHVPFTRTFAAPAVPLPLPMSSLPPKTITRTFDSLSQAVAEAESARVYAGLHFREGCVAGARQGRRIGSFVFRQELRGVTH
jgi:hypothetical protein